MIVEVSVFLKPEIFDPQSRAVLGAMSKLKHFGLCDVRQGKKFILTFDKNLTSEQLAKIREVAAELLTNSIIEQYSLEIKHES